MHPASHCTLVIFGLTVAQVLRSPEWINTPRDLNVVELWAGVGHVAKAAQGLGLQAATFEKDNDPQHHFLHQVGFLAALALVMRLAPGGLLAMGPTCSTFVFSNSSNNQRLEENGWAGDPDYPPTHTGNLEAQIAWFFLCLATCRSVEACLENPTGSCIFKYLRCKEGLQSLTDRVPNKGECVTFRCAFVEDEPVGQRIKKGSRFVATGSWIEAVKRPCPCKGGLHRLCMTKDHKGKVSGNLDIMRESQSYPPALGQALVSAWWHSQHSVASAPAAAPPLHGVPHVPGVPGVSTVSVVTAVDGVPTVSGVPANPARPMAAARHSLDEDLPFFTAARPVGRGKTATTKLQPAPSDDDLPFSASTKPSSQGKKRGPATPVGSQSLPFSGQPSCKRPATHQFHIHPGQEDDELPFGC